VVAKIRVQRSTDLGSHRLAGLMFELLELGTVDPGNRTMKPDLWWSSCAIKVCSRLKRHCYKREVTRPKRWRLVVDNHRSEKYLRCMAGHGMTAYGLQEGIDFNRLSNQCNRPERSGPFRRSNAYSSRDDDGNAG
jgi:hypothetical protein